MAAAVARVVVAAARVEAAEVAKVAVAAAARVVARVAAAARVVARVAAAVLEAVTAWRGHRALRKVLLAHRLLRHNPR